MGAAATPGKVFLESGAELRLDADIARGGEGRIFPIQQDSTRVVKIYHKPDAGRVRKLEAMLRAVPEDPSMLKRGQVSICWPQALALNQAGDVVGFVMPRLDTAKHHAVGLLWNPADRVKLAPGFTWKYLCVAAANICSLMELIHAKGHVIGDVNEENILVSGSAIATVVDCDSIQVKDPRSGATFRSPVSREAFISPERLGKPLAEIDRSPYDDYWALAILVFSMLMEGQHPAHGIGYPIERERRLRLGLFPFLGERGFSPPRFAVPYSILPPHVRSLFERCLREGHANPAKRPTAGEWRQALQVTAASMAHCAAGPLHWYSAHLPSCPWCEERNVTEMDRFAREPASSTKAAASAAQPASSGGTTALGRFLRALFN